MSATPRRPWLRYSLRTLLVLITALGVWLGFTFHRAREQARAVAAIKTNFGHVRYDYQGVDSDSFNQLRTSTVPSWLLESLGVDFFHDVTLVAFELLPVSDETLAALHPLREVRHLAIRFSHITDNGLAHLKALPRLQFVHLVTAQNDAGDFDAPNFGDAGLAELAQLHGLEHLRIYRANISDRALEHLTGLTRLKWLVLSDTNVTLEGAERLSKSLPSCNISVTRGAQDVLVAGPDIP